VADTVLGYVLCFARGFSQMDRQMKKGIWSKIQGTSLRERTLGIIGVGNVGRTVARRAHAFGMRIVGNDLVEPPAELVHETKIEMMSKTDLLGQADFVTVNCDLNPTSYHILSDREFALMKPRVFVINTARGPLIDEAALIHALEEKRIAGAALDVFEVEPLSPQSPLCRMENVFLAPHNANSSPEAWERTHANTIRNLLDGLKQPRKAQ
jgi:D-3-phosphoglycerate dehydrogenase / 2-oxoglutarate reductase